jgi:CheY-like chemotaxis protein
MSVESQPGKGTCIALYIPAQDWQEGAAVAEFPVKQADVQNGMPTESILVVEDDPQVRDVVAQMLLTLGYTVESCSNGIEALSRCAESTFDLVLVDMMMPEMNGAELIQRIKSMSGSTRTLIMTGYGAQPEEMEALNTLVIPKPFDLETLSDFILQTLHTIQTSRTQEPSR